MAIKVGDKIPSVKLKTMTKDGMKEMTTDEIFKGKVVLFALPGAFTPTCSAKHLPGFMLEAAADHQRKRMQEKQTCCRKSCKRRMELTLDDGIQESRCCYP